jgi:hypothetical protein
MVVLAASAAPRPPASRRYVSPPLQGGTRYTFLYPNHMGVVREDPFGGDPRIAQSVRLGTTFKKRTFTDALRRWLPFPRRPKHGYVTIIAGPANARRGAQDSRKEQEWVHGSRRYRNLFVIDARSRLRVQLYHEYSLRPAFTDEDRIVTSSFRLLRPGEAVPVP